MKKNNKKLIIILAVAAVVVIVIPLIVAVIIGITLFLNKDKVDLPSAVNDIKSEESYEVSEESSELSEELSDLIQENTVYYGGWYEGDDTFKARYTKEFRFEDNKVEIVETPLVGSADVYTFDLSDVSGNTYFLTNGKYRSNTSEENIGDGEITVYDDGSFDVAYSVGQNKIEDHFVLNDASPVKDSKRLYADKLADYADLDGAMFDLFDFDGDGTEELIISEGEAHLNTCDVIGINNGELTLLCENMGEYGIIEAYEDGIVGGYFNPSGPGQQTRHTEFVKISNGKSEFLYELTAEGFPPDYDKYTMNGAEITAEEYNSVLKSHISVENALGRKYNIDDNTINSVLLYDEQEAASGNFIAEGIVHDENGYNASLFKEPDLDSEIIDKVGEGETLYIDPEKSFDEWYYVRCHTLSGREMTGYINDNYVILSEDNKPETPFVVSSADSSSQLGSISTSSRTYSYNPSNVLEANDDTCWCEGVNGSGTGEYIILYSEEEGVVNEIIIKNGLCTNSELFYNNNRIKDCTIEFSDGTVIKQTLNGDYGDQPCKIELPEEVTSDYVKITIDSVYKGEKHNDTCVTQITIE